MRCTTLEQLKILQVIVITDEFQRQWQWFDVADIHNVT